MAFNTLYTQTTSWLVRRIPETFVGQTRISSDFQCHCLAVTPTHMQRIMPMADNSWDIKIFIEKNPLFFLSPEEADGFCHYYDLLRWRIVSSTCRPREEEVNALSVAFFYYVIGLMSKQIRQAPRTFTSGEYLFKNFINLLASSHPKNRKVEYYAEKLYVTPKYLSLVCKKCGNKTASKIISLYVLKDIDYLLKYSSKSIKEIVNELEFPNISFFGKYVKKHFGISPKAYRIKALRERLQRANEESGKE